MNTKFKIENEYKLLSLSIINADNWFKDGESGLIIDYEWELTAGITNVQLSVCKKSIFIPDIVAFADDYSGLLHAQCIVRSIMQKDRLSPEEMDYDELNIDIGDIGLNRIHPGSLFGLGFLVNRRTHISGKGITR